MGILIESNNCLSGGSIKKMGLLQVKLRADIFLEAAHSAGWTDNQEGICSAFHLQMEFSSERFNFFNDGLDDIFAGRSRLRESNIFRTNAHHDFLAEKSAQTVCYSAVDFDPERGGFAITIAA